MYVCTRMNACMYVHVYVGRCMRVCTHVRRDIHVCVRMYAETCMYAETYMLNKRNNAFMNTSMHACVYAWINVCMYVCMHVCVHEYMQWLRLVGSIKLWVSYAEYSLFYRAFLLKRPIILSILFTAATPYPLSCTPHTLSCTLYMHIFSHSPS